MVSPVIHCARSEIRNNAGPATSSGVPRRPRGIPSRSFALVAAGQPAVMAVSMTPGLIILTVTLLPPHAPGKRPSKSCDPAPRSCVVRAANVAADAGGGGSDQYDASIILSHHYGRDRLAHQE